MGRIILARFLEQPPRSLERLVARTDEEAALLNASCNPAGSSPFAITTIPEAVWRGRAGGGPRTLASIEAAGDVPRPVYRSEAFVREYRADDPAFDQVLDRQDEPDRISSLRLLKRMRLINSRNRLTHTIILALIDRQTAFVTTGDPARLSPLTQRDLVDHLQQGLSPGNAPAVDTSRVSRVLASGSVLLSGGQEVELRRLCPSARDVHREMVRGLFRREQARIVASEIDAPLTDDEIAEEISARGAGPTSRRAVAFIRKDLGVPSVWARARRGCYLTVTAGFSILRRVDSATMKASVPWAAGVYELRVESPGIEYPAGLSPVIYLGSSNSLRKRLFEHVGGNSRNAQLAGYLRSGRVQVRWMVVPEGWRSVEREVYQQFVETFGAQPACNRMSP